MATAYTSLLGFALPVTGELSGTWGDVVNNSITQLVEDSVANYATENVTSGDWTLTTTGSGASNQARMAILRPTGTPGVSRNILAPNSSKAYIVDNQSDAAVVVKGVTGPTTGATVPAGSQAVIAWNGSDFVLVGLVKNGALGTPSSGTLTNCTGLPISTGVSGLGTSVATALAVNVGTAGSVVVNGGALGTPSSGTLTYTTGLPISTGVSGLGTGVATALAINVGTAGSPVVNGGALGTPSSGTVTNLTGTASININGTVGATTPTTGVFTQVDTVAEGPVRWQDATGGQYVAFKAPATVASSVTWTLPNADGSSSQVLTTNGSGTLSWGSAGISAGKSIALSMIFGF